MTLSKQIADEPSRWRKQALALTALILGLGTVVAAAAMLLSASGELSAGADLRWLLPPAVVTTLVAIASLLRREGTYALPIAAICLAGSALVLGWIVIFGLVALGAAVVIAILSQLM